MNSTKTPAGSKFVALDQAICRARIVLGVVTLASMYVDPTVGGFLGIGKSALIAVFGYLLYGIAIYLAMRRGFPGHHWLWASAVLDVLFATAITTVTEGATSPSFAFFLFAIVAAGYWSNFRGTLLIASVCVTMYLIAIAYGPDQPPNLYLMRAGYLAIAGYLITFVGEQRTKFEQQVREMEAMAERENIARFLHDGYIQALAGVNLRIESCRDMLKSAQPQLALAELTDLQSRIDHEYDRVRAYVRALADARPGLATERFAGFDTNFSVRADFVARGLIAEQVLLIALEGIRNTCRHGRAQQAALSMLKAETSIRVNLDDDGIGFEENATPPWTIASRVDEFGGRLTISKGGSSGAHLQIDLPVA